MSGGGNNKGNHKTPGGRDRWLDDAGTPGAQALRRALDDGPADDDSFARQRVWNRVQMPWAGEKPPAPAGRRRLWPVLVPAIALSGVAAAAVVLLVGRQVRQVEVPLATAPGTSQAPEVVALPPPATIALTTGPDEEARHRLARGVSVELAARSALIPGDQATAPEVKVGRIRFSVPHQAPGHRYTVRAGGYQVVVLGTTFDVAVGDAGVGVAVASGVVAVEDAASGRQLARLLPGMRWSSAQPQNVQNAGPKAERRPRRRSLLKAAALRDPAGARVIDEIDEVRQRGDVQSALARYQRVVDAGGPMAQVALYEIGSTQAEHLHDLPAALATWELQRTRYPKGLLRAETDLSIVEALARTQNSQRALAEARAFLERYPNSERRSEVARVAGDLARTHGDCKTAVGFYETASRTRAESSTADDAAFHRTACLATLGDGRAPAAAREYLARFPLGRHAVDVQRLLAGGKVDAQGP